MRTVSALEATTHFNVYLEECEKQPIVVTKAGKPCAVLVAVLEEEALESLLLAYQQDFWAMLDAASRNIAQTGGIAHEEFWQSVEQKS